MSTTIETTYTIVCAEHDEELDVEYNERKMVFKISPCKQCLEKAKDEGYDEGYREGEQTGFEESSSSDNKQ